MKKSKLSFLLMGILCAAAFAWCVNRDMEREKQYTVDLRNRIVGARLQMDGKLPYFYKWKPEDGIRYYDPIKLDTTYTNAITASPFFHHLLYPIANLPQRQLSKIWLGIEYCLFIACVLIAFSLATTYWQRWAVAITGILGLFTVAWQLHVYLGQYYIVIPFLAMALVFCLRRKNSVTFALLAGCLAATFVFTRPSAIVFFLPFLLLRKQFSAKYLICFLAPILLLAGYSLLSPTERSLWADYKKSIAAHMKDHMSPDREERMDAYQPPYIHQWEGWHQDSIRDEMKKNYIDWKFEFSNISSIAKNIFHINLSEKTLIISLAVSWMLLVALFYYESKQAANFNIAHAAIFGFCLYMLADFFSPIRRIEYYAIQWMFPLLLCASLYNPRQKVLYILLAIGVLLEIADAPFIKMRHTLGELIILLALLWFSIFHPSHTKHTSLLPSSAEPDH